MPTLTDTILQTIAGLSSQKPYRVDALEAATGCARATVMDAVQHLVDTRQVGNCQIFKDGEAYQVIWPTGIPPQIPAFTYSDNTFRKADDLARHRRARAGEKAQHNRRVAKAIASTQAAATNPQIPPSPLLEKGGDHQEPATMTRIKAPAKPRAEEAARAQIPTLITLEKGGENPATPLKNAGSLQTACLNAVLQHGPLSIAEVFALVGDKAKSENSVSTTLRTMAKRGGQIKRYFEQRPIDGVGLRSIAIFAPLAEGEAAPEWDARLKIGDHPINWQKPAAAKQDHFVAADNMVSTPRTPPRAGLRLGLFNDGSLEIWDGAEFVLSLGADDVDSLADLLEARPSAYAAQVSA